jgi:hypothetical protein
MKTVCNRHAQAYEVGSICPYCDVPMAQVKTPSGNHMRVSTAWFSVVDLVYVTEDAACTPLVLTTSHLPFDDGSYSKRLNVPLGGTGTQAFFDYCWANGYEPFPRGMGFPVSHGVNWSNKLYDDSFGTLYPKYLLRDGYVYPHNLSFCVPHANMQSVLGDIVYAMVHKLGLTSHNQPGGSISISAGLPSASTGGQIQLTRP